jgi:hypothetical protein
VLLATVFALAGLYILAAALLSIASWLADRPDLRSLRMATKLDPGNAEYAHRVGRYYDLVANDPTAALAEYHRAVALNPHDSRYWLDLANTYQLIGDLPSQAQAIEQAIHYDSKTPDVAWEAANLYLVQGETDKALRQFRTVMEGDPYRIQQSLQLCWRVRPDVEQLLRDVVPQRQDTYEAFLTQLMAKDETEGAVRAWESLVSLRQPIDLSRVFDYIRYLVQHRAVDDAGRAWRQATSLTGMSAYLPSSNNLIVNGSFTLPVLNGGFDWQYQKQSSVSLTLDPSDFHSGHRSLAIVFDGPGVEEAGISQWIVVQPNTTYDFSGFYKNLDIEGAGGPHFVLQDYYSSTICFQSEELKDGAFWKNVSGECTTGADTRLLALRIQRLPAGSPIRGRLWIDDLKLVEKLAEGAS